ncbi:PhzF family phenazine biosynthesis protein [Pseudoduganella aquatica]|uniref:PhzF family phenazine biosynthesis protein n=1 Tax=Pseudoduganella aquatica TaxID=2660641 RepID=A0A7X4HCS2_9BURK|nr:PhzF family phenazine biosynthesis protein [Pseudoduganella aquatica]MYN08408.1 PhzF family phenazine biosynthesis protein [Pseudoduganella aquatica]
MQRTVHELKCFGSRPGEGNAALVVLGDASSEAQRQDFARAQNRSACVFVDAVAPADGGGAAAQDALFVLDYYYPHMRSPLCLHATLAAARVLLREHGAPLAVRTALRGQLLHVSERGTDVFVRLQRQPTPDVVIPPDLPAALLGQPSLRLASAPAIASVGSPKLLLELDSAAALQALRPDLARIAAWGKEHGVSGCYAYARRGDGSFEGRNFNHLDPALEDSATGVAAGALTVHLGRALTLHQGAALGQPCVLRTELDGGRADGEHILIGGAAAFLRPH